DRRAVLVRIFLRAESRIVLRRQLLEADELAIERAALLEIVDREAHLDRVVELGRCVRRDYDLDRVTVRVANEGREPIAARNLLELGGGVPVLDEALHDRFLLRVEEGEEAQAR